MLDQLINSASGRCIQIFLIPQCQPAVMQSLNFSFLHRMSLMIMIFVNYGGGGYWFFDHSIWNGLTVADLVFPWFIWIMGVSLVFSFRGRRKDSTLKVAYQIIRRTIILFAVGLFLNTSEGIVVLVNQ